jgi:hypothetical protein
LYKGLNKRIAVLELENLDEHLDRFIENKDATNLYFQVVQWNNCKTEGRLWNFNQVGHSMVRYIKYWLKKTDTAEIIKKSSSSMPCKDHSQIDDLEIWTLISQLDHYNTYLDTDLILEGCVIATMFEGEIRLLDSHLEETTLRKISAKRLTIWSSGCKRRRLTVEIQRSMCRIFFCSQFNISLLILHKLLAFLVYDFFKYGF